MIIKPTQDQLVQDGFNRVSQACGITNATESGFAMNIVRVMAQMILDLYDQLEQAEQESQISTAVGEALDRIGNFYGIPRLLGQPATTLSTQLGVTFINNGGASQLIPARTRVWTSGDTNVAFYTTNAITINGGGQGNVDVVAASSGAFYNVGAGTLNMHSLANANLIVTNPLPIQNGSDTEIDGDYRSRISQQQLRREGPNLTSIRQSLLEVPGIRDVLLLNLSRGPGTLDVLIVGWDRIVDDAVLAQAQSVLDAEIAVGVSARAIRPRNRYVDAAIYLTIKSGGDATGAAQGAVAAAHGYLDNLPVEDGTGRGVLSYSELAARIQIAHPDILSSNVSLTIDNIPSLRTDQIPSTADRFVGRSINTK